MKINVLKNLHSKMVVSKHWVNTKQRNQAEVSQHFIKWRFAKFSSNALWIFSSEVSLRCKAQGNITMRRRWDVKFVLLNDYLQLLIDVTFVNERMKHIQNTEDTPNIRMILNVLNFFSVQLWATSELSEWLKLIDKFINDFPKPLVGEC